MQKLKALKSSLKAFNHLHYSHISTRAKEADLALQNAQTHLESYPGDVTVRDSLGILGRRPLPAERHLFQKAKNPLLKGSHTGRGQNVRISDNKALGPDGYTSCFFKKAWNIVGDLVRRAVMEFCRSGRMLRQLNHTIIDLVPKSEHSPSVADYRSISCSNVIYKVITKIITDRLSPALVQLSTVAKRPSLGAGTSLIIYSLKKWFGSTRGNGFHLVVPLTST
ncbi:UNVERIFIED_CONTAM: hypothetical protein Sradi_4882000 [Sesamum radiatum]|uniref:Reverse transcriptase n=1 Tax=Sesamum radiatum TaxID=300843 RepID=A0AAW2N2S9_SESRA